MKKVINTEEFNNFETIGCCHCYKSGADTLLFKPSSNPNEPNKLVWVGDAYHSECIDKAHLLFAKERLNKWLRTLT